MPGPTLSRGPLQVLRESPSARRLLTAVLAFSGAFATARALAGQLLKLMLYHPARYQDDLSAPHEIKMFEAALKRIAYRMEYIEYALGGGSEQRAFLVQPEGKPAAGLWAIFGGNAMLAADWFSFCAQLLESLPKDADRPALLLVDYPGYGANGGTPSPQSISAGSLAAVTAALPRLTVASPGLEFNVLGHSLGAAAASQLALQLPTQDGPLSSLSPGRLVLSAPFLSIQAMAQAILFKSLPTWALRPLISHRWDNYLWVPQAVRKGWCASIIHGELDEIVPVWQGQDLDASARSAGNKGRFVKVPGAGHNDLLDSAFAKYTALMFGPLGERDAAL